MGQTLENGIYLPSEGERNCYSGLANNWQTVDTNIGYVTALRQAIAGALTRKIVTQLPTEDIDPNCIYMILKATAQTSNIYDEYMYINSNWELIGDTQLDLSDYYTKQEVNQLPAVASGVTSTKVGNYDTHIADGDIHVTANDKAKWNTVALIKQLRLVNAQVGSATTIAFADIDDTNGIKVGDKCMDLDAKLFEITAVDTTNQTVTVGSALIDIALDANVVHNAGDETVGGIKTFSDETYVKSLNFTNEVASQSSSGYALFPIVSTVTYTDQSSSQFVRLNLRITADGVKSFFPHDNNVSLGLSSRVWSDFFAFHGYFRGQQQGDEYSTNARTNLTLLANRDTSGQSCCVVDTFRENTSQGTAMHILGFGMKENSVRYEGMRCQWAYDSANVGYNFNLAPTRQGTNNPLTYNLGTSTNKWDTINGLEPSALGLPDLSSGVDISSYVTVTANADKESLYTPPANGWVSVRLSRTSGALGVLLIQGNMASSGKNIEVESGATTADAMLPVVGGVQVSINSALADGVVSAYFYPCQGNI